MVSKATKYSWPSGTDTPPSTIVTPSPAVRKHVMIPASSAPVTTTVALSVYLPAGSASASICLVSPGAIRNCRPTMSWT